MQRSQWFHYQLQTSTKGFLWAAERNPQERQFLQPKPDKLIGSPAAYHLVCYDQLIGGTNPL